MTGPFEGLAEEADSASPAPAGEELKAAVLLIEAEAGGESVNSNDDDDDDAALDRLDDNPAGGDSMKLVGDPVGVGTTKDRDDGVDRVAETATEVERTTTRVVLSPSTCLLDNPLGRPSRSALPTSPHNAVVSEGQG